MFNLKYLMVLPKNRIVMIIAILFATIYVSKSVFCEEKKSIIFIDDIPLIDTMSVEPELSFSFDSPSGRIMILIGTSHDNEDLIKQFYRQVMPTLGWELVGDQYQKGEEKFQVISSQKQDSLIWRLTISPLNAE